MSVYRKLADVRYEAQYPGCRNSDGTWKTTDERVSSGVEVSPTPPEPETGET